MLLCTVIVTSDCIFVNTFSQLFSNIYYCFLLYRKINCYFYNKVENTLHQLESYFCLFFISNAQFLCKLLNILPKYCRFFVNLFPVIGLKNNLLRVRFFLFLDIFSHFQKISTLHSISCIP